METSGEVLLKQGQVLREEGKTFEAIDSLNRALGAFAVEKNMARFAHAILDRAICWQHLYQLNGNHAGFGLLCLKDAESALELVRVHAITEEMADVLFMNAKAHMLLGRFAEAVLLFKQALETFNKQNVAQKADWQTSYGKALYLDGQKEEGTAQILSGIESLKSHEKDLDSYVYLVWLSGGYLRLAEVLAHDDPEESNRYLDEAKRIINSDSRLSVRKKQLENYLATGNSGL